MSKTVSRGSSAPPPATLDALRSRIDTLDQEIHALLMERARTVSEIARAKGPTAGATIIHPGREVRVLMRRLEAHEGPLPASLVAHIWRAVIAAACHLQRPFDVHAVGLAAPDGALRDLARFWFGFEVGLIDSADGAAAIAALEAAPGDLALVPVSAPGDWWSALSEDGVHVIGRFGANDEPLGDILLLGGALVGPGPEAVNVYRLIFDGDALLPEDVEPIARRTNPAGSAILAVSPLSPDALAAAWGPADGPVSIAHAGRYDPDLMSAVGNPPAVCKE
ncbi:chorismate mutase [Amorphus sp. 3PC139-8]|uniref:chorismate mutase n=1 Tax=Amorphus sp. 3PC139-8 TaxID=2735676 RepID=UPI00345D0083